MEIGKSLTKNQAHMVSLFIFTVKPYSDHIPLADQRYDDIFVLETGFKTDVLNDNHIPSRSPLKSLNEGILAEILSPFDIPSPYANEPPVSAARSSSYEFNFDDQSLRERDIRSALIYGCQHEDVVGLSVIQEIVNKYKTVPASNACVERGFSVLKTAHTCKQKMLGTQLRFDWFLYHEVGAVAALAIEDIEKAMNIEREAE
ncbi:hypothetical protein PCE1_000145 [Barthelona sp. PCE]